MEILKEEKEEGLIERAKMAIFRIDNLLIEIKDEKNKIKMLRVAIFKRSTGKQELSIKIPIELANLAIQAISNEKKRKKLKSKCHKISMTFALTLTLRFPSYAIFSDRDDLKVIKKVLKAQYSLISSKSVSEAKGSTLAL